MARQRSLRVSTPAGQLGQEPGVLHDALGVQALAGVQHQQPAEQVAYVRAHGGLPGDAVVHLQGAGYHLRSAHSCITVWGVLLILRDDCRRAGPLGRASRVRAIACARRTAAIWIFWAAVLLPELTLQALLEGVSSGWQGDPG